MKDNKKKETCFNKWISVSSCAGIVFIAVLFFASSIFGKSEQEHHFPTLVGLFESTVTLSKTPQKTFKRSWYFLRSPGQLEIKDVEGQTGELWKREADGQIYYFKLFHKPQRVIDFFPGDLLALERKVNWNKINHVIDSTLFGSTMHKIGQRTLLSRLAYNYEGELKGVRTKVLWLEAEQLPARIVQKYHNRTVTIELKDLWPMDKAPTKHTTMQNYQHTDYSDIGDLEADPFLKQMAHQHFSHHNHSH